MSRFAFFSFALIGIISCSNGGSDIQHKTDIDTIMPSTPEEVMHLWEQGWEERDTLLLNELMLGRSPFTSNSFQNVAAPTYELLSAEELTAEADVSRYVHAEVGDIAVIAKRYYPSAEVEERFLILLRATPSGFRIVAYSTLDDAENPFE